MRYIRLIFLNVFLLLTTTSYVYAQGSSFANPLNVGSIQDLIAKALMILVQVSLPIISLFIVYSGFQFVAARGNPESIKVAKRNFLYIMIGTVMILGALLIANLLSNTVNQLLPAA